MQIVSIGCVYALDWLQSLMKFNVNQLRRLRQYAVLSGREGMTLMSDKPDVW